MEILELFFNILPFEIMVGTVALVFICIIPAIYFGISYEPIDKQEVKQLQKKYKQGREQEYQQSQKFSTTHSSEENKQ